MSTEPKISYEISLLDNVVIDEIHNNEVDIIPKKFHPHRLGISQLCPHSCVRKVIVLSQIHVFYDMYYILYFILYYIISVL